MSEESLGSGFSVNKLYYLVFLFFSYLIMFFLYLGLNRSNPAQASTLVFYMWFGVPAIVIFLVDLLIPKNVNSPIESISYENNSPFRFLNNFKVQLILSAVMAILLFINIKITGQAFLKAPTFSLDFPILGLMPGVNNLLNAFISGFTAGLVETIVFWGAVYPITHSIMMKQGFSFFVSSIITVITTAIFFTIFHWWVYGYLISALLFVFLLGIIWGILVYLFRSLVPLFLTHFINNFAVSLFVLSAYSISILFQVF